MHPLPVRRAVAPLAASAAVFVAAALATPTAAAATPAPAAREGTSCRSSPAGAPVCRYHHHQKAGRGGNYLLIDTVLPNLQDDLEAWVEYNPLTCALVSTGQWTVTTPPQYGTTTLGTLVDVLGNGDCPGVLFTYALISYTWTSTDEAAKVDNFAAQWSSPDFVEPETFTMNLATVTVSSIALDTGSAAFVIIGPAGATGTLTLEFSGANGAASQQTTSATYPTGNAAVTVQRPAIARGVYDTLKVKWNASTPPVSVTYNPPTAWNVLGTIRYSQYNAPNEASCTGGTAAVWVVDSLTACNFTAVNLVSSFVSQVNINGTGISTANGILKAGAATSLRRSCRGHFPPGATLANSLLQVNAVIGSCNTALVAGSSVATHASLGLACGDGLELVQTNNANLAAKERDDTCPACSGGFQGADGHIDSYSANQACSGHGVGDLGRFWTVQTN